MFFLSFFCCQKIILVCFTKGAQKNTSSLSNTVGFRLNSQGDKVHNWANDLTYDTCWKHAVTKPCLRNCSFSSVHTVADVSPHLSLGWEPLLSGLRRPVLGHFWASTPISFSFRCPWDFSTSTVPFLEGKPESTHGVKGRCRWRPPWAREMMTRQALMTLLRFFLGDPPPRQSNVQVLWDDRCLIRVSYWFWAQIHGDSDPPILTLLWDLHNFWQFLTQFHMCYMFDSWKCWEMRHDQIEEAHLGVDARSCGSGFVAERIFWLRNGLHMNHMLTPQAPTCFTSTPINLTWDPGTNDP